MQLKQFKNAVPRHFISRDLNSLQNATLNRAFSGKLMMENMFSCLCAQTEKAVSDSSLTGVTIVSRVGVNTQQLKPFFVNQRC